MLPQDALTLMDIQLFVLRILQFQKNVYFAGNWQIVYTTLKKGRSNLLDYTVNPLLLSINSLILLSKKKLLNLKAINSKKDCFIQDYELNCRIEKKNTHAKILSVKIFLILQSQFNTMSALFVLPKQKRERGNRDTYIILAILGNVKKVKQFPVNVQNVEEVQNVC